MDTRQGTVYILIPSEGKGLDMIEYIHNGRTTIAKFKPVHGDDRATWAQKIRNSLTRIIPYAYTYPVDNYLLNITSFCGKVTCSEEDEYNEFEGEILAKERLLYKYNDLVSKICAEIIANMERDLSQLKNFKMFGRIRKGSYNYVSK